MGIAQLREQLGADLTMQVGEGGKTEVYTLGDKTAQVPAGSSPTQIAAALNVQKINQIAGPVMTDPLPTVTLAPAAPPTPAKPAPGSFAASIRAIMNEARDGLAQARADGIAQVREAVGDLQQVTAQTKQVTGSMVKTIQDETATARAELGQISNMPPEDAQ
jgi:hypothetical protein